jgi:hypothetical protein
LTGLSCRPRLFRTRTPPSFFFSRLRNKTSVEAKNTNCTSSMQEPLQNIKPNKPKPNVFANFLLPQHSPQNDPQCGQLKPLVAAPVPHPDPARHPFIRSLLRFSSSLPARIFVVVIAVMLAVNATPSHISISAHPRLATWQSLGHIFRWRGDYDIFYRDSQARVAAQFSHSGDYRATRLNFLFLSILVVFFSGGYFATKCPSRGAFARVSKRRI